ncbi:hypothetical protein [Thiothrix winogradskyi]|uniref:Uncharacterized protein n=1 Tax=Thiothrix winogradskyi TaxID=96472 RepID=A0ABY3T0Q3_9GAMM|nr:hypothetical protein [Thiothrix winogradskyi]UJS24792.1 hypothetical protein L2Y54_01780 [Thiothrix winogradskyi]
MSTVSFSGIVNKFPSGVLQTTNDGRVSFPKTPPPTNPFLDGLDCKDVSTTGGIVGESSG